MLKILNEPSSEKKLQDLFLHVGCKNDFVQSAPHTHLITYKKRCLTFDVEWFVQESCRNQEKPYLIDTSHKELTLSGFLRDNS